MSWTLDVRVIPNSRKAGIEVDGEICRIKLTAPAVDGKANKQLVRYVAERLGIRRSAVRIIRGEKSRVKTLSIDSPDPGDAFGLPGPGCRPEDGGKTRRE